MLKNTYENASDYIGWNSTIFSRVSDQFSRNECREIANKAVSHQKMTPKPRFFMLNLSNITKYMTL